MTDRVLGVIGYGLPVVWILGLLVLSAHLSAVVRLIGATIGLLWSIKLGGWLVCRSRGVELSLSPLQTLLYWTVWPGVRPDLFDGGAEGDDTTPDAGEFVAGYVHVLVGAVLVVCALLAVPLVGSAVSGWLLLFGILSMVHFGVGRLLPFGLRYLGVPAPTLFNDPLRPSSVGQFWSDAWNRPFVNMNRFFLTKPLAKHVGIGTAAVIAFLISGALHELALSYAAGGGWGLPTLYFLVQAAVYTAEKRLLDVESWPPLLARLWTYAVLLGPLPLLFHVPFRETFLVPVVDGAYSLAIAYPPTAYLAVGLWLGAAGHFLVLAASVQVPKQLDWADDLQSLQSLNRKLLWTYGGYIVMMIVAFGVMTIVYHGEFLAGNPVALGLAALVVVFWAVRILIDVFYFSHEDWPEGIEFVVGHVMLTSLFLFLVVVYGATIGYHLL